METIPFTDKKIAVLGAGVEGIASAEYLARQGANVTVLDQREQLDQPAHEQLHKLQVMFIGGKTYLSGLETYDMIVRAPGMKRNLPELVAAEKSGVKITSQTQLFFQLSPATIIGVTGTKGKGTTSSLIYEMLKEEGLDAYLGGNIGVPPFLFLEKLQNTSWVVLELSSFQLEDLQQSPHIAVMLMITSDHLGADTTGTQNYHETIEEYIAAKRNIVRFQSKTDFAVLNRDYPATHESDIHTEGKVFQISRERESYGDGCYVKDGVVWLRLDTKEEQIISVEDILLPGKHNWENVCSAVMASRLAGVSKKSIVAVLRGFKGLEHRLELVKEIKGVKYYDDSFSTTPETAIAAIEAFDAPEVVILGGSSKGSDFTELGRIISERQNIRAVIGIGNEWPSIKQTIYNAGVTMIEDCKNMQEVVKKASEIAKPGDVVLLTPACASFGWFNNYKERGNQFKTAVTHLE